MASLFLFLFMSLFLIPAALTSAVVDIREMSIDEYINFVNPPPVHKYEDKFGDSMLCIKFSDHISVKYAHDNITRIPLNISNFNYGGSNIPKLGIKGECPEGTVVIREIKREHVERAGSVRQFLERGRRNLITASAADLSSDDSQDEHALAIFKSRNTPIAGVSADLNVWRPDVGTDAEFSASQIALFYTNGSEAEVLQAGWTVFPERYGDDEPRFFVYWTSDSYQNGFYDLNGCYDQDCPGFVSTHGTTSLGSRLSPASEYGGTQHSWTIAIKQQERGGETVWAVHLDNEVIGHLPASLFHNLAQGGNQFLVGGIVSGTSSGSTPMGSGHLPGEGYRYAAYTKSIELFGSHGNEIQISPKTHSTKPYKVTYDHQSSWGKFIFFGGPPGKDNF